MEFSEPHFYISVETYYKDKKVDQNYIDNNPELFANYPYQNEIDATLKSIRDNQEKGVYYLIKVSE
jgi:hypothetical protein